MSKTMTPREKLMFAMFGTINPTEEQVNEAYDKINEDVANSVSDEDYKNMTGRDINEDVKDMMLFVHAIERGDEDLWAFINKISSRVYHVNENHEKVFRWSMLKVAQWQFENLMNKVMDWLPNAERYVHINVDNNGGVHTVCYTDKMISDFREAMGVKILMMDTSDSLKLREYLQVPEIDLERAGFVFDPYNPPPDTIVTESNEPLAIYDKAKKC